MLQLTVTAHNFRKKIRLSLSVLLVMLLVGEGLVRGFTNTGPPLVMRDPLLGRRFVPAFEDKVIDVESKLEVLVRTNSDGFRMVARCPWTTRAARDHR